jgi:hypothetical protein
MRATRAPLASLKLTTSVMVSWIYTLIYEQI